jgi:hypothetical protein
MTTTTATDEALFIAACDGKSRAAIRFNSCLQRPRIRAAFGGGLAAVTQLQRFENVSSWLIHSSLNGETLAVIGHHHGLS